MDETVFLFDVDNTLLDNDRVTADLRRHLDRRGRRRAAAALLGRSSRSCAQELGYADYLGALQRYRVEHPRDPHLLAVSACPGQLSLRRTGCIPASLDVVERLRSRGPA